MIKKDKILLFIMTVGLSLMLILRDIYGVGINKFLYLALAVACMTLANYQMLVNMICFILPLVNGLPGTYIMPVAVILLIFKRGKLNLASIFCAICLSVLEIVASFWYPKGNVPDIVQYISFMAVMILMIHNSADIDYEQGVRMYLYGTILLCGVVMVATIQDAPKNWLDLFARGAFRFGNVDKSTTNFMALSLNPNALAYYSLIGIGCGILLAERRQGSARVLYIVMAVFAAVTGFFTVTRSWVIVFVLVLSLYVLSKLRTPKQFVGLAAVLIVLTIVGVFWLNQNPQLLDGVVARFTADDVEGGNNRTKIFWNYMEQYFSDPRYILIGTGVTQYIQVLQTSGAIHNGTQQILICTGIVGFVLYMFALVGPVLQTKKYDKRTFANWLPLLGLVAFAQFIPFLNPAMLILPYIIGVYALRIDTQTVENRIGKET